jgi:membrane glycosyltransferase
MEPQMPAAEEDQGALSSQAVATRFPLWRRRVVFGAVNCASVLAMTWLLFAILSPNAAGVVSALMIAAFAVNGIWVSLVFWNAAIGFCLLRLSRRPTLRNWAELERVSPAAHPTKRTAIAMTVRNERAGEFLARLKAVKKSLDATHSATAFDYFILSDSSEPTAIADERRSYAAWCAEEPEIATRVTYRLRDSNWGYKPGNVRDFCKRWGANYEFLVLLDADSLMTGETIARMVGAMERFPQVGILQSLVVGILHPSLFARVHEFGHRHIARCVIAGSTWWQGDRCQFWGHNAVIRIAPFARYCEMPEIPGRGPFGGHILCHDQIEASFMHRAGFEVRAWPEEVGSYEGNPPTAIDYCQRNNRWCRGNFQNLVVAFAPGLALIDRFHLTVVAQRFIAYPAQLLFILLAALEAAAWPAGRPFRASMALVLYLAWAFMVFAPRFVGVADALIREPERYGGRARLLAGAGVEFVTSFVLISISIVATSTFMAGLMRTGGAVWKAQRRDGRRVPWRAAAAALWPQALLGVAISALLGYANPAALVWFSPFLAGLVLAIPYCVFTASPAVSTVADRLGICATPEEIATPREVAEVAHAVSAG